MPLTELDGLLSLSPLSPPATGLQPKEEVCFRGACRLHKHDGNAQIGSCTRATLLTERRCDALVGAALWAHVLANSSFRHNKAIHTFQSTATREQQSRQGCNLAQTSNCSAACICS